MISQRNTFQSILIIGAKIIINVVACVLKKNKKILISSRPSNKEMPGFFEFPGGKVKKDEFIIEALRREIFEELNIKIYLRKVLFLKSFIKQQKKRKIKLLFFECDTWIGKIRNNENQEIRWIFPNEIDNFNMLKSNQEFVKYFISYYSSIQK